MENPGDEGNLVQEAEILKAFSIVAGVRCEGRRLTLVEECHDRWVESARTFRNDGGRNGGKEVRP